MTLDEFMGRMLAAFPNATVDEDNDGQLVVYTNFVRHRGEVYEVKDGFCARCSVPGHDVCPLNPDCRCCAGTMTMAR